MINSLRVLVALILINILSGCTMVDDYMLGKDNTPKPEALSSMTSAFKLHEHWSTQVGGSYKSAASLKLRPSIQGNVIYTVTAGGNVTAIDKNSGKLLWAKALKQNIVSGPVVKNGTLVIGTATSTVIALNQATGIERWTAKVSGDVLSLPVITSQYVIAKTINGYVYALSLRTGETSWVVDHGSPSLILKASSSPTVMGNMVLVGFSDGKLDAIDIQTGHVIWERSIAYASGSSDVERLVDIDADPIIANNTVYLATYQGYVGALSLTDGAFIWNKPASVYRNLGIDSATLYLVDSSDVVWAYDKQTGQVQWRQPAFKARGLTEPILFNNRIIVGDGTGWLHIISRKTGALFGRESLGSPIYAAPLVQGNALYILTANGKLGRYSILTTKSHHEHA